VTRFRTGDLVKAHTAIATSFSDRVAGTGLSRGTVGVVVATAGSKMTVDFKDSLWGHVTHYGVGMRDCRLVSRNYGIETFRHNRRRTRPIRLGIAIFTAAPFVWFAIQFFLANGLTLHGFITALVECGLDSAIQLLEWSITAPVQTAALLAFLAAITWVAKRV